MGEPICCGVVLFDGGPRLWLFHFFQCFSEQYHCIVCTEYSDDMTTLIICARERTGTLSRGIGPLSEQKICNPARLRARVLLRYSASEFVNKIMLLDL